MALRSNILVLLLLLCSSASARFLHVRAQPDLPAQNSTTAPKSSPTSIFRQQFDNPSEVLSVLLLIGGDIVQKAIAQLVGRWRITPAAFSFGWVSYAFIAINSAFGDGTLMPLPDFPCKVINLETGNSRQNESWVVGRLLRDLELDFNKRLPNAHRKPVITILKTSGVPARPGGDSVWWSFMLFVPMQLFIAAWPVILPRRNWTILFVTAVGTLLATATSSLPQWSAEKFNCRKNSKNCYVITRGNGHPHIFVIQNGGRVADPKRKNKFNGISLNFEDLAVASPSAATLPRVITFLLAILWVAFLITVGGLKQDAWFLLGVGGLGMIHNIYVASKQRTPEGSGIPLKRTADGKSFDFEMVGGTPHIDSMEVLKKGEEIRAGLGLLLLNIFFNGNLKQGEADHWTAQRRTLSTRQKELEAKLKDEAEVIAAQPIQKSRSSWLRSLRGPVKPSRVETEGTIRTEMSNIATPPTDLEEATASIATGSETRPDARRHSLSAGLDVTVSTEPRLISRSKTFHVPSSAI